MGLRIFAAAMIAGAGCLLCAPAGGNSWQAFGPAPQEYAGPTAGLTGRVDSIAYSPNYDGAGHPALYIAPAGGGVWRSTDFDTAAVITWTPLTDNLGLPAAQEVGATALGSLAVDAAHPNVIYAATGDQNRRGGAGVLKSTNGGNSWTLLGGSYFAGRAITRIFVDPTHSDGNTLYCSAYPMGTTAANDGVWKSTDGGVTWSNVNNNATFQPWFNSSYTALISDLEYTVNGATLTIYAAAQGNGIWKSVNGGASWNKMANGAPAGSPIDVIKLAADHASGASPAVYALVGDGNTGGIVGVYKTTDGTTWAPTAFPADFAGSNPEPQENYDLTIGLSPDNQLYVAGAYASMQSLNGGLSWSGTYGPINVWVDTHSFGFAPDPNRSGHYRLYRGDDGGIWRFNPKADGTAGPGRWDDLNSTGLQTTLMYSLALHPTDPGIAVGGCQDTGVPRRDGTQGNVWNFSGNDYGETRYAPGDGNTVYTTSHGGFGRADDGGLTYNSYAGKMNGIADSLAFFPVYATCPPVPTHLVIGSNRLFETTDRAESWHPISPALANTYVSALAYSPADANTIYAAFPGFGTKALIFRTINDGASWSSDLSANGSWTGSTITGIAVDPANKDIAYIGLSGTSGGRVWKTIDGGAHWADITGDLPAIPVNALVIDPRTSPSTIYVGTDIAVWASTNGGTNWTRFGGGMPSVQVTDLAFDTVNNRLGAATFGRGAWVISLTQTGPTLPTVTTLDATNVTSTTATINGKVSPNGADTTAFFLWGHNSANTPTASHDVGSGTTDVSVSADLTGLTPNTTYSFNLHGSNSAGPAAGTMLTFTTTAGPTRTVTTDYATNVSQTGATLNATVNPNGAATNVHFVWGVSALYGSVTVDQAIGGGTSPITVSLPLSGVAGAPHVHFAVVATSTGGLPVKGGDSYFVPLLPVWGTAVQFDGVNSGIERTSIAGLAAGNTAHTVEAWVYVNALPANRAWMLVLGNDGAGALHWLLNSDGSMQVGVWSGTQAHPSLIPGQWTHLASVFDGTNLTVYVNGQPVLVQAAAFNLAGIPLTLGEPHSGENGFSGVMDDVRIWSVARTAAQIQQDYRKPLTGGEAGLLAYYKLDDGAGITATDSTGHGYPGTLVNGATWVQSTVPVAAAFTTDDVRKALSIAGGLVSATSMDLSRLNVEAGATIDVLDAVRIARKAAGLDSNP